MIIFGFQNVLNIILLLPLVRKLRLVNSFSPSFTSPSIHQVSLQKRHRNDIGAIGLSTILYGGIGIAKDYSWKEEQCEIELKVPIPEDTKQNDIIFKANLQSIQLSVRTKDGVIDLVDGDRKMRGRIDIDGTFWSFSDSDHSGTTVKVGDQRYVVITIEKLLSSSAPDQFDIVEYDWGGIYRDDDDEILSKKYKEPEVLNVREYAASLGVDIDNIDMSKVDKNMFTSGLNMTRSSLDELCKMGYAKEITRQYDGNEYEVGDEDGEKIPFDYLGKDIGKDEIDRIPENDLKGNTVQSRVSAQESVMSDPINSLSVERLRDILRAEGVVVDDSVGESELRTSLRQCIQDRLSKSKDRR